MLARVEKDTEGSESFQVRALVGAIRRYHRLTEALDGVANNRNPDENVDAHHRRLVDAAFQVLAKIENEATVGPAAIPDAVLALKTKREQADAASGLVTDDYAAEHRAAFRALPEAERVAAITEAQKRREDGPFLAAILRAPRQLAGLPASVPELAERTRAHFHGLHAPEAAAELRLIEDTLDIARAAHRAAVDAARELAADKASLDEQKEAMSYATSSRAALEARNALEGVLAGR